MPTWDSEDRPALSVREQQVLVLIAAGHSAKEAARRCELSPRTVQHHIESLRHKLRARNTPHAIAKAAALGELPNP